MEELNLVVARRESYWLPPSQNMEQQGKGSIVPSTKAIQQCGIDVTLQEDMVGIGMEAEELSFLKKGG